MDDRDQQGNDLQQVIEKWGACSFSSDNWFWRYVCGFSGILNQKSSLASRMDWWLKTKQMSGARISFSILVAEKWGVHYDFVRAGWWMVLCIFDGVSLISFEFPVPLIQNQIHYLGRCLRMSLSSSDAIQICFWPNLASSARAEIHWRLFSVASCNDL